MAIPAYAILRNIGRVRVLEYRGDDKFTVLDNRDNKRFVHRSELTFIRGKK